MDHSNIKMIESYKAFVREKQNDLLEAKKPWLRQTPTMMAQAKGNKGQVIVEMSAEDFLLMTTKTQEGISAIKSSAKRITDYNRYAKIGHDEDFQNRINNGKTTDDSDYEWGSIHMPWLTIQISDDGELGRIVNHEGRHRAASVIKDGNGMMQILLIMKAGKTTHPDKYSPEYYITAKDIPPLISYQYINKYYDTRDMKIIKDDIQNRQRNT